VAGREDDGHDLAELPLDDDGVLSDDEPDGRLVGEGEEAHRSVEEGGPAVDAPEGATLSGGLDGEGDDAVGGGEVIDVGE